MPYRSNREIIVYFNSDFIYFCPGENYHLAYSIMDSSRVSTFFISILLIVYGSFRSLAMEETEKSEEGKDVKEGEKKETNVTTLDSIQVSWKTVRHEAGGLILVGMSH